MSWLQTLLDWLRQFWPYRTIAPWQRGLRITYLPKDIQFIPEWPPWQIVEPEAKIEYLEPGLHFVLPFVQDLRTENVKPQVMDLLSQTTTLKDMTQASFSVNIEYVINDVEANIMNVHLFKFSMEAASRVHLARRTREMGSWNELIEKQDWLEDRLKETLTTRAKKWGVKVIDVGFTDLSSSKTLRLLGDGQNILAAAAKEEYE